MNDFLEPTEIRNIHFWKRDRPANLHIVECACLPARTHTRPSVCLSAHLSIRHWSAGMLPICPSLHRSVHQNTRYICTSNFICLPAHLPAHPPVHLSVCLPICLLVSRHVSHLSLPPSVRLFIKIQVTLSACICLYPPARPSVCLSAHLSIGQSARCPSVPPSICSFIKIQDTSNLPACLSAYV